LLKLLKPDNYSITEEEKRKLEEERKQKEERELRQAKFAAEDTLNSILETPNASEELKKRIEEVIKKF